ncbi:MAG TPA: class I SAM-dependent methyltransferase [Candidatus Angelobacter sp.]|nr:class I SAM-dependent methyltransferase [Candidatus Angelobacter sp.]
MKPLDCLSLYEDASFYDEEFRERAHEIPFYLRQVATISGPVLELACGTGRITLPLAARGVDIAGVDASAEMIALARQKAATANLAVEWHVQDVRSLRLNRKFALAFIATNALQHLQDLDSLSAFFRCLRTHLQPDGLLILDVFNPNVAKLCRGFDARYLQKSFSLEDGRTVEVEARSEYLPETQVLHFVLTYRHAGQILRTKDVRMRCFFPEELLALCRLGGFDVTDRFGDYDESPFTAASPKQIVLCRPTSNPQTHSTETHF